jgi:hypothetical protein
MDIKINIEDYLEKKKIDPILFQKMLLLYNALEEGWTIKKRKTSYIFTKNHENKKEILEESYLLQFMKSNLEVRF